ncbi:hypothetical protein CV_2314 [Chromobacterium violaceum ATCC 12472]|uniref:Uncharacterized protein n=1 Tax=Chromobacterium violaceum (strain ATCC 12472 / DSM 30191 / JCM 1249 / CCUG 213 / NBRC 12614 / NCIMB 9131 / NCTC 9757 / MK) TaxID=243365 RepID=Q7NVM8_CHRVO|nr:hypothetical protein CV_2314 [Chromobacterium violaceum ATCC 12472]
MAGRICGQLLDGPGEGHASAPNPETRQAAWLARHAPAQGACLPAWRTQKPTTGNHGDQTAIFDFDGALADAYPVFADSLNAWTHSHGLKPVDAQSGER